MGCMQPLQPNVQSLCQWDNVHSSVGHLLSFDQYCANTQIQVLKSAVLDSGIKDLTWLELNIKNSM